MAISEKKQILRGMHVKPVLEADAAPGAAETSAPAPKPELLDNRIEAFVRPIALGLLYLPFALGLLAISWVLYGHWYNGVMFRAIEVPRIMRDAFILAGIIVLMVLLGLAAMFIFRDTLSAKRRWWAFGLLMGLVPLGIAGVVLMPICHIQGRAAAYRRLDFQALASDAQEIRNTFPPASGGEIRAISQFDPDYSSVPRYTREVLKPQHIFVHDRGVTMQMGSGPFGPDQDEGMAIPLYKETAADMSLHEDLKKLSATPRIYQYEGRSSDFEEFLAPGSAPLPPPPPL